MANAPATTSISTEPVVGWRIWNLSESESGPALLPAGSGSNEWPRRRPIEASCTAPILLVGRRRRHEVPGIGCRCGVYASRSLDVFGRERPAWPPAPVVGRASLWGRTIVHERGWRARFAYPERLRLECAVCLWVEPGTRVPSVVHAFAGRLYTLCGAHRGGIEVPDGRRTRLTDLDPRALEARMLDAYAVDLLPAERLESLHRRSPAAEKPGYFPSIRLVPPAEDKPSKRSENG
jgi:hypothetical protein